MPRREEARERLLVDGFDLAAERRQRRAAQAAQHVGVAPLALAAAGSQLAAHEQLVRLELGEDAADVAAEALVGLARS